jgi:hypothetical protein
MLFNNLKMERGRITSKDQDSTSEIMYQGLPIVIENEEGSTRKWKNEEGDTGKVQMFYAYGYIKGTVGVDGEGIDCFIGHNPYSPNVYVITLGKDDHEEKIMLGFDNKESARDAFLAHYQDQAYLGEIVEMPIYLFKATLEFQ